jgi:hypothetical protein
LLCHKPEEVKGGDEEKKSEAGRKPEVADVVKP